MPDPVAEQRSSSAARVPEIPAWKLQTKLDAGARKQEPTAGSTATTSTTARIEPSAVNRLPQAEQPEAASDLVTAVFGEPMPTRIERFRRNPTFPYAPLLAAPTVKILKDGMVGGPIDNEIFTGILDDAYRQSSAGSDLQGVYHLPEKDAVLEWSMDVEVLDASQPSEDGSPPLTKKYAVTLSGQVGNESFEKWHFADISVSEDGGYIHSKFYDPNGGSNGISYSSGPGIEESLARLEGYRNGIPSRKLALH
jgi:hypothetical protein